MTRAETASLLRYMIKLYPNSKMPGATFDESVDFIYHEFENDSCELVGKAFRLATQESPDWMPTIRKIQEVMRRIASAITEKSPEKQFADQHCGKTPEEWDALMKWEKSEEGAIKLKAYKQRFEQIMGGLI